MADFVLDCSVTMAWCFDDEAAPYANKVLKSLLESQAIVPTLWTYEISNVLLMAERKKRITAQDRARFLNLLQQLPITVENEDQDINTLILLSKEYQLTPYDGCYLSLALGQGLPLATFDHGLKTALQAAGGRVYKP